MDLITLSSMKLLIQLRSQLVNTHDQGHKYALHGSTEWQSGFVMFLGEQDLDAVEKGQGTMYQKSC